MDIVLDFDGTCITHNFPNLGEDIGAIPVLKRLTDNGHNIILFTMRCDNQKESPGIYEGDFLTQAVNWFIDNDIPLYGVQKNPTQHSWTSSPKAYGQLIIDDAALGCPLKMNLSKSHRAFVDWDEVERSLEKMKII
jgi:hypothetical protein